MLHFYYFIFWRFAEVKNLGTCDLSGLWLLAEPSDQVVLARILIIFFYTHVLQKQIFPSNFAFFGQLKPDISNLEIYFEKRSLCCKLSQDFESSIKSPFG